LVAAAFALTAAADAATASPIDPGANLAKAGVQAVAEPARFGGGGGGHMGGFGGAAFHGGGGFPGGHFSGHSQFRGQAFARSNFSRGRHFDHGHHRHRFFIGGYPYFYYDDGYYDDDYGDCWLSRRYHRWVCSDY